MQSKLNITEARKQLLDFPKKLLPGESIDVIKHHKTVLKITRVVDEETKDPLTILDEALVPLQKPSKAPPKTLAAHYKEYLYGKKK